MSAPVSDRVRRPRPFTVDEFYRLAETGFFGTDHQRLELIDGEILEPVAIGPAHAATVTRLHSLLSGQLGPRFIVRSQNPVRLGEFSEPLPDVAVLPYRADFYSRSHPIPDEVILLIEVADSTLEFDLGEKARQYAKAGIKEYWVVDLPGQRLRLFRQPENGEFTETRIAAPGQIVTALGLPGFSIEVQELFS